MLGSCPLRVMRSKTAIVPVNTALMPRSMDEVERCGRTVYAANIDNKVDKHDVRAFFEQLCGEVWRPARAPWCPQGTLSSPRCRQAAALPAVWLAWPVWGGGRARHPLRPCPCPEWSASLPACATQAR